MSDTALDREMAPKRQRMLDMVLALGGLKEESAIPISRVKEEIARLKEEIAPLTDEILDFPIAYFNLFLQAAEKNNLVNQIKDKGILKEAIANLQTAISVSNLESIIGFLNLLKPPPALDEDIIKDQQGKQVNLKSVLGPVGALVSEIESILSDYEKRADADAEAAKSELISILEKGSEILSDTESDKRETLELLQKLGTKTRYGPFLRMAAQVKRGLREERIDEARFAHLVKDNIVKEFLRGIILFILTKMGSKTVLQLSELMGYDSVEIQSAIISMIQRGEIEMVALDDDTPVFARVLSKSPETTLIVKRITQQARGIHKITDEEIQELMNKWLPRLESILNRLQVLGDYEETTLSELVNTLRMTIDNATEVTLRSQSSETAEDLRLLVSAGLEAFARFRLKIALEKGPNLVSGLNVYGEKLDPEIYRTMMDTYLDNELERGTILILIREIGPMSAHDLAEKTNIPQNRVLQHLLRMKRDELLTLAGESHGYVLYDVPRTLSEAEVTIQTASTMAHQLVTAKTELEEILSDLKPEDIGTLVNSLEAFSKARDKLAKITVSGAVIGESILTSVEDKIKSAVLQAYRTRTRIPSTRPKVTLDDLMDVDVPSVLDEYRSQMGYAPLLGFGTIEWKHSKCLGCKSCEIACPEDAISLKPVIEISKFFGFSDEEIEALPANRAMFYRTIKNLATVKPAIDIILSREAPGFGRIEVDLWLCVACRTCVRRCPGPDDGALELELKWNLPEVVRQITSKT